MTDDNGIKANQFLTFTLDEEVYALGINQVREVLDFSKITKIPQLPDFMRGVINLRGGVVPVVDLRLRFGMDASVRTVDTCIIIIEIGINDEETELLGVLADSVQEVMSLEPEQIEPPPKIGTRLKTEFIMGIGKRNDDFIIILDINKVFSFEDLLAIQTIAETGDKIEACSAG